MCVYVCACVCVCVCVWRARVRDTCGCLYVHMQLTETEGGERERERETFSVEASFTPNTSCRAATGTKDACAEAQRNTGTCAHTRVLVRMPAELVRALAVSRQVVEHVFNAPGHTRCIKARLRQLVRDIPFAWHTSEAAYEPAPKQHHPAVKEAARESATNPLHLEEADKDVHIVC